MNPKSYRLSLQLTSAIAFNIPDVSTVYVQGTDYCFLVLPSQNYYQNVMQLLNSINFGTSGTRKGNFSSMIFITVPLI